MSKPYTTQTITGFNTNAPADDGSQVATNEIAWDKHVDKLATPVKDLSEDINTELLSAFGLIFGQEISTHATNYTVIAGDQGKFLSVTATTTITLLAAATAGASFALAIINNGTATVTIDGNASETINGNLTIELSPGESIILTCNGTLWVGPVIGRDSAKGADIASATTTDIGAATGNYVDVTGTTTITGLGTAKAGTKRTVQFDGILTLTYNATSLILPGNADITTAAGDVAKFVSLGSGNWLCTNYQQDIAPAIATFGTTTVSGSAVATITVSGLNSSYLDSYKAFGVIICTGTPSLFLEINADTTTTNYNASIGRLGTSYAHITTDALLCEGLGVALPFVIELIQNATDGTVEVLSRFGRPGDRYYAGTMRYSVTDNITSIAIRASTTTIGVGSHLTVKPL